MSPAFLEHLRAHGIDSRSAARKLSCLRGFYKWLLLDRRIHHDPTVNIESPKSWKVLPKSLAECGGDGDHGARRAGRVASASPRHYADATAPFWSCFTPAACASLRLSRFPSATSDSTPAASWCAAKATRNALFPWAARHRCASDLSCRRPPAPGSRAQGARAQRCGTAVSFPSRNAAHA